MVTPYVRESVAIAEESERRENERCFIRVVR